MLGNEKRERVSPSGRVEGEILKKKKVAHVALYARMIDVIISCPLLRQQGYSSACLWCELFEDKLISIETQTRRLFAPAFYVTRRIFRRIKDGEMITTPRPSELTFLLNERGW